MFSKIIHDEIEMASFAREFAKKLKVSDILALRGDLGAGKTFFARHAINFILQKDTLVTSPTFNLVKIYNAGDFNILHLDLFRLRSQEEFFYLGIAEEFNNSITFIEWPQIIENILPSRTVYLDIKFITEQKREIFSWTKDK